MARELGLNEAVGESPISKITTPLGGPIRAKGGPRSSTMTPTGSLRAGIYSLRSNFPTASNPKKLGKIDNHGQEPWKMPLPQFIEDLHARRFGRTGFPDRGGN
jgi:hypothetical protein